MLKTGLPGEEEKQRGWRWVVTLPRRFSAVSRPAGDWDGALLRIVKNLEPREKMFALLFFNIIKTNNKNSLSQLPVFYFIKTYSNDN